MVKFSFSIFMVLLLLGLERALANFCAPHFMSPKIAIISGTDRPDSATLKIATHVSDLMKSKGHDVTLLNLMDFDPTPMKGQYFKPSADFKSQFISKITEADGYIFVFPEYYGSIPGILKQFIDYINPMAAFQGKPVGLIGDAEGAFGGMKGAELMSEIMRHRRADVIGESYVLLPEVSTKLVDGKIADADILRRMETAIQALVSKASTKYQQQMQINAFLEFAKNLKQTIRVTLNSQAQIEGRVVGVEKNSRGFPIALQFEGPVGIKDAGKKITDQLLASHNHGIFAPIGQIKTAKGTKSISEIKNIEGLEALGFKMREQVALTYVSGYEVKGTLTNAFFSPDGKLQVITMNDATIMKNGESIPGTASKLLNVVIGENITFVDSL